MNVGSTLRITVERLNGHGKVLERGVVSFHNPPYVAKHWVLRRGGKRSKKYETITITQFLKDFGVWIRTWLAKKEPIEKPKTGPSQNITPPMYNYYQHRAHRRRYGRHSSA